MIVVSDTSPLNYLVLIGHVDVLPALFERVVTPPAVIAEMLHPGAPTPVREWASTPPQWLEVVAPASIDLTLGMGAVRRMGWSYSATHHSFPGLMGYRCAANPSYS